jgi:PPM family protein phosphatase
MTTTPASCPACRSPLQQGDRFCEQCGSPVPGTETSHPEGQAGGPEDRLERDLTTAAVVSDRGRVHGRNEDAFFLEMAGDRTVALVVCDGISSASAGNVAARDAAQAAGAVLAAAMADPSRDPGEATVEALQAAHGAVANVEWTTRTRRVDPSCTLVSALCRGNEVMIGWAGDSRAYWSDAEAIRQLTVDDSFAEEGVAEGLLTPEQAARSPYLHSVTNWVGPAAPARPPRLAVLSPERPGRLLLCTDGLWNYFPSEAELRDLINSVPAGASAAALARALTEGALERGGRDNITVAVVDLDPSAPGVSVPGD